MRRAHLVAAVGLVVASPAAAHRAPRARVVTAASFVDIDETRFLARSRASRSARLAVDPPSPPASVSRVEPSTTTTTTIAHRLAPPAALGSGWPALRQCESGGNYADRRNPKYRGAYQFDLTTWASVGGHGDPADAPPAEQDARAQLLYQRFGRGRWPVCGRFLP